MTPAISPPICRLITSKGCGSAVVEAALELAGLPYAVEEVDPEAPGFNRDRLLGLNPLGQVPVLLPDGTVLTESAAMVLHLAERAPGAGWRPHRPWFVEHGPRLHAIALSADADPRLAAVWRRNRT
jgi:glutathione S-transferase